MPHLTKFNKDWLEKTDQNDMKLKMNMKHHVTLLLKSAIKDFLK